MTAYIGFFVPASILLTSNQRLHWAPKSGRTAAIRSLAYRATRNAKLTPMDRAHCTVHVTWPGNQRRRDVGNLMPTVKAAIDGIVTDGHLLPNDDDAHLIGPDLRVTPPGNQARGGVYLEFIFEPVSDGAA